MSNPLDVNLDQAQQAERQTLVKDILSLAGAMLAVESVTFLYSIYTLELYHDGRWKPLLVYSLLTVIPLGLVMIVMGLRWGRGGLEFYETLLAHREPTRLQAENAVRSILLLARNCALIMIALYLGFAALVGLILYRWYGYPKSDVLFLLIFRGIGGVNLGIIAYYALKIINRPNFRNAVERLLSAGVYEWQHFKISIRYKIFTVILAVIAYLLCCAILMGFSQAQNVKRVQMQENLANWVRLAASSIPQTPAAGLKAGVEPGPIFREPLIADARLVALKSDGTVIGGQTEQVDASELEKILSLAAGGEVIDHSHKKIIVTRAVPGRDLIVAGIGYWGLSSRGLANTFSLLAALFTATVLLSLVASYLLVTDINTPLQEVLDFLRGISSGQTGQRLTAYAEDEMGDFARELACTTALLESKTERARSLLGRIMEIARAVEDNSREARSATERQAAQVNEQAGAVAQVSSTANEVAVTASQIAANAAEVRQAAEQNLHSCESGNERVNEALEGFRELGDYVNNISRDVMSLSEDISAITGIVELIEEIAAQIDLLSLNAQLEAAGAGEQGKRFTVVAEEIKRLDSGTLQAAQRIKRLGDSLIKSVESAVHSAQKGAGLVGKGRELADAVGHTLKEVQSQAGATLAAAQQIVLITNQQRTASEQMAEVISSVHTATQQVQLNTAQVLSSMEKLSTQAGQLTLEFRETAV